MLDLMVKYIFLITWVYNAHGKKQPLQIIFSVRGRFCRLLLNGALYDDHSISRAKKCKFSVLP